MKPSPFSLHLPESLAEALDLLASSDNARVIAGGQSLMPMLNLRLAAPDDVIDLNGISELAGLREEGNDIVIGAMTRQRDIEFSPMVAERLPLLKEAILNVGHRQTRNRGTVGGSLCHLDPSAEQPAVAVAMDVRLSLRSVRGERTVSMRDFAVDLMTSCLEPDEVLAAVRFTPWPARAGHAFVEYGRRHGDFAIVSAAALVLLDAGGAVERCSLTLGGVASVPFRVEAAERVLQGSRPTEAVVREACSQAAKCEAISDPAYPAWYRQRLAQRLLERTVAKALERAAVQS
ncbi:MAG: xanthine dehydrogenase family protein subunit M [Pigmentiphaga sp.]|uniref:FAD binding domain-containing protein n=1 Tax=Pigmentiphaga sp. TaxID=1977564 RepID=UPI0029ABDC0B|nr:xanthine dehydrogenase family protein subunit M [Pigmentiphaga sp.]MDX3907479.1 xanthine dehydrogenase family protein subunit M [Pigmentiphaga sp.]